LQATEPNPKRVYAFRQIDVQLERIGMLGSHGLSKQPFVSDAEQCRFGQYRLSQEQKLLARACPQVGG